MEAFIDQYDTEHRFTIEDIRSMHSLWLGKIYEWAGEFRQVNMAKGGFHFAAAQQFPKLMKEFEAGPLRIHTPCQVGPVPEIAAALAETHVELALIHPFREGNGRISRALCVLMALQAGLPFLDFSAMTGVPRDEYFAAVRCGLARDYSKMTSIFVEIIRDSTSS